MSTVRHFLCLIMVPGACLAATPPASLASLAPRLTFEVNRGQTDPRVRFLSRLGSHNLFLNGDGAVLSPGVTMKLEGARPAPRITGVDRLPGVSHYLVGSDPSKWTTHVPHFAGVRYEQIYPGVDLIYYGNQQNLEYDFVVAPGADYRQIRLRFSGASRPQLDADGDLLLESSTGILRQRKPVLYQQEAGRRKLVEGGYVLDEGGTVRFEAGDYDPSLPLTIDPLILYYSSYLGGGGDDRPRAVAADQQGNTYVAGVTNSANFPTAEPYQRAGGGKYDVFVTKLDRERGQVVYSTYLGGAEDDEPRRIVVDVLGNIYVAGNTKSSNFPTTPNAFQRAFSGAIDAFVAKLNPAGSQLIYSTYFGGRGDDLLRGFALDGALNAYLCGATTSTDLPRSPGSFGDRFGGGDLDGFVAKLNAAGSQLIHAGYLGGRDEDAATAIGATSLGEAFVTGWTRSANFPTQAPLQQTLGGLGDAFLVKIVPSGIGLEYSSFLGGSREDVGTAVLVDRNDDAAVFVTGITASSNFPRGQRSAASGAGGTNVFVSKFRIRLGAGATEAASNSESTPGPAAAEPRPGDLLDLFKDYDWDIRHPVEPPWLRDLRCELDRIQTETERRAVDNFITAALGSRLGPIKAIIDLFRNNCSYVSEGQVDFFSPPETRQTASSPFLILNSTSLQIESGPLFPSTGPADSALIQAIAMDRFGTLHVVAETENAALPVSSTGTPANRGSVETYIARFSENPPPPPAPGPTPSPPPAGAPRINSALNGASFSTTGPGVTPGSIVSLFGERLAASTAQAAATPLPTTLAGASVTVAGRAAPIFYASPAQVNIQIPYETPAGQAQIVATVGGVASAALSVNIVASAPGIFTFGTNRAVVQNQDFSVNTAENPAQAGSVITAYLTGGGGFDNANRLQTGAPTPAVPLNQITLPAGATIGGQSAEILFLGLTPGLIGVVQANLRVPNLASGTYPLVVTMGGVASNGPLVTVAAN